MYTCIRDAKQNKTKRNKKKKEEEERKRETYFVLHLSGAFFPQF